MIERRLLINYRIDPTVVAALLPAPFRPQLVGGCAVGGVCLIRLGGIRPHGVPERLGLTSENAAHRIAVEWLEDGTVKRGVYIPRRDSNSRLNTFLGGRLFPGVHHRADFTVNESEERFSVALRSVDGDTRVSVSGRLDRSMPPTSVFGTLAAASAFFREGAVGYSPSRAAGRYDGLELRSETWKVEPLAIEHVASSFFDDPTRFPPGSIVFDSALVMREVSHEWHTRETLCGAPAITPAA